MSLPTTVGSTFAGTAAGFYISAALKQSTSLEFTTLLENIKYKQVIQRLEAGAVIGDAGCDFLSAGTLALTEQVIEPKNLQVNLEICKANLLSTWESLQMRAGAGAPPPPSFEDYLIAHLGEIIAQGVETSIWSGTGVAASGTFTGFLGAGTGLLLAANAPLVIQQASQGGAGTIFDADNIVQNFQLGTAAIPATIYTKEDLYIYVSPKTYRLYIQAVSASGFVNQYSMNDDYTPVFEGIKIAVCQGMLDNHLVIATKENLYFGTDLLSDTTRIDLLDMAQLDGSDNMRMVARYSAGVQYGIESEIVVVS